jgi:shikimate 5-dehydrogenase
MYEALRKASQYTSNQGNRMTIIGVGTGSRAVASELKWTMLEKRGNKVSE